MSLRINWKLIFLLHSQKEHTLDEDKDKHEADDNPVGIVMFVIALIMTLSLMGLVLNEALK